ncbi:metallophosphoesterase [Neisseriaceae bacterium JH1-16]|nr:metallophosphoesterase [Neisseriaceae bacterium JH1-16]
MSEFRRFELNRHGRDWVVGDLHGCFGLLERLLRAIDFQTRTDRLFSVGDLVDRGPDSAAVMNWLALPWFYSVRGNHEQTALDTNLNDPAEEAFYEDIGGAWFINSQRSAQAAYRSVFKKLPLAIEVTTKEGAVGIVHADCPLPTWAQFIAALTGKEIDNRIQQAAQWSRSRSLHQDASGLPDLRALIVGHTPHDVPETLGNVVNIDTGAVYGNTLTALCLQTLDTVSVRHPLSGRGSVDLRG